MSETAIGSAVRDFESVADLRRGLEAKANFEAVDLYPRDGSQVLGEVEDHIAKLARVETGEALAYTSGMAAVTDAIDAALHWYSGGANLPVLACAEQTYTQTKRYIDSFLRDLRAEVFYFDSGNPDEVSRIIEERGAEVIVAETVSNYINVPVLDPDHLLEVVRQRRQEAFPPPSIVLDNTLPLSTAEPLGEQLQSDDRVIVVESGTKSYSFNAELLGIGYSRNPELLDMLRRYRRTRGTLPGLRALSLINDLLPDSVGGFDERNLQLFQSTGDIALQLFKAGMGENHDFLIAHPALPNHDNYEYYTSRYPLGATPLFYIQSLKYDQYAVAEKLWAHPGVREQARLGQSFGFDHTRIVADENVGAVRIAGGAETDGQALGEACAEALYG